MKLKTPRKRRSRSIAQEVIQEKLELARDIAPGTVMAGGVIAALDEAGYVIMSHDDLEAEIALAYQAGYDEGREA